MQPIQMDTINDNEPIFYNWINQYRINPNIKPFKTKAQWGNNFQAVNTLTANGFHIDLIKQQFKEAIVQEKNIQQKPDIAMKCILEILSIQELPNYLNYKSDNPKNKNTPHDVITTFIQYNKEHIFPYINPFCSAIALFILHTIYPYIVKVKTNYDELQKTLCYGILLVILYRKCTFIDRNNIESNSNLNDIPLVNIDEINEEYKKIVDIQCYGNNLFDNGKTRYDTIPKGLGLRKKLDQLRACLLYRRIPQSIKYFIHIKDIILNKPPITATQLELFNDKFIKPSIKSILQHEYIKNQNNTKPTIISREDITLLQNSARFVNAGDTYKSVEERYLQECNTRNLLHKYGVAYTINIVKDYKLTLRNYYYDNKNNVTKHKYDGTIIKPDTWPLYVLHQSQLHCFAFHNIANLPKKDKELLWLACLRVYNNHESLHGLNSLNDLFTLNYSFKLNNMKSMPNIINPVDSTIICTPTKYTHLIYYMWTLLLKLCEFYLSDSIFESLLPISQQVITMYY
ncbi:MAG: hypothetical protein ACXWE6_12625, partial [Nitrososphaeraceae archaeon]